MVLSNLRGTETGRIQIGSYTAADRANITGLLEASSSAVVPIGTRRISVQLAMIGTGLFNDAYADNLSLVLTDTNATATSVPEPSAILGVLIGGALVVGAMKKRRKNL
ncbi:PEP-CTERM sorting domain-containing protein [Chamaesiphon sp. GL140_3_metabinner_50]|uniref:PEP-CTERM sorting domain-containing protein n=1 Tax=Chamaesiphon sp. GL140_3_metabinner_50 TaxID=2970812 RepID=UPI0025EBBAC7|nr:PEP-CTERM sorting domain-containing protein [Chamaesiphon sp. GL140_3_metabinner_50]